MQHMERYPHSLLVKFLGKWQEEDFRAKHFIKRPPTGAESRECVTDRYRLGDPTCNSSLHYVISVRLDPVGWEESTCSPILSGVH